MQMHKSYSDNLSRSISLYVARHIVLPTKTDELNLILHSLDMHKFQIQVSFVGLERNPVQKNFIINHPSTTSQTPD